MQTLGKWRIVAMTLLACMLAVGCRGRRSTRQPEPDKPNETGIVQPTVVWHDDLPATVPDVSLRVEPARQPAVRNSSTVLRPPTVDPLPDVTPPARPEPVSSRQAEPADALVAAPVWTPPTSQPATAPAELSAMPPPAVGQFVVYSTSLAGPQGRLRQTVESLGPTAGDVVVSEQTIVSNQPVGKARLLRLPRFGRQWPGPMNTDARTVSYSRERIGLAGRALDCIVLTIETRAAGSARVEKQWISADVPVTHVARLLATLNGREVLRQELVDFGATR